MLSASGPIRKAGCVSMRLCAVREGGGGGGVGAVRFRFETKSEGGAVRIRLDSIISYIFTRHRQTKNYTTFDIAYNQYAYTAV